MADEAIESKFSHNAAATIEKIMELNSTPWRLYVPKQKSQQLLEQSAHCIGIQATLVSLGINFELVEAVNAEWMSKNGQVPVLIGTNTARNVSSGEAITIYHLWLNFVAYNVL